MQFVGEALPLRHFAGCFNQRTRSSVVRHFGTCSSMLPEAHSSMLSREEHPRATFQGSTIKAWLTGKTLATERLFIAVAQDVCFVQSQREHLFHFEFAITHKNRYFAFSHRFMSFCCQPSSHASLGGACSPQPARGNSADDGAHLTEFLFLKNVTLGKGFGPE